MNKVTNTEEYWMGIVDKVAEASTCRVNVGCVLMKHFQIVGTGYVGSVRGDHHCDDIGCILVETDIHGSSEKNHSCINTMHAELNAVLKCHVRDQLFAFCTMQPCLRCLQAMLQIGVKIIVYQKPYRDIWRDKYIAETQVVFDMHEYEEGNELFASKGIPYTKGNRLFEGRDTDKTFVDWWL